MKKQCIKNSIITTFYGILSRIQQIMFVTYKNVYNNNDIRSQVFHFRNLFFQKDIFLILRKSSRNNLVIIRMFYVK